MVHPVLHAIYCREKMDSIMVKLSDWDSIDNPLTALSSAQLDTISDIARFVRLVHFKSICKQDLLTKSNQIMSQSLEDK